MQRLALISDIHGNIVALDAVLADIDAAGLTDTTNCLGDLVGYGPRPAEVIERIRTLDIPTIRGNYDQGVGDRSGSCGCYYATEQERADGDASYAFTAGALGDVDKDWLSSLRRQFRFEEADVRVLLAHGSPRLINEYLMPDRTDEQLVRLALAARADAVCVGHVHMPYHRAIPVGAAVLHYVSSGSVGKPKDGDPRACWVELCIGSAEDVAARCGDDENAGPAGEAETALGIVVHRVEYDVDSVAADILAAGLPQTLAEALRQA